ncbi:MAG: uracil-DNA glycosylase family protein [Planctomycetaceae bacterium]
MKPPYDSSDRIRRQLWQRLRSLHAAGVRHLPHPTYHTQSLSEVTSVDAITAVDEPAQGNGIQKDEPEMATPKGAVSTIKSSAGPKSVSPPDRESKLQVLAGTVSGCQRCPELACQRTQTVFGVGDPCARIMFIGEAPGRDEDQQGEPFVGRAGQLLDKIIEACKMKREEIYIANILKCRPPDNRTPLPEEAANCREYLDAQIAIVQPEYIVCWGSTAAQNLLGTTDTIGKLRKQFFQHGNAKVLCTYHPSYLLRNPNAKKDVWDDMKFFFHELGVEL